MEEKSSSFCTLCQRDRPRLGDDGRFCLACGGTEETFAWACDMCSNITPVRSVNCGVCGDGILIEKGCDIFSEFHTLLQQATLKSFDEIVSLLESNEVYKASQRYKATLLVNSKYVTATQRKILGGLIKQHTEANIISSPLFPGLMLLH